MWGFPDSDAQRVSLVRYFAQGASEQSILAWHGKSLAPDCCRFLTPEWAGQSAWLRSAPSL
jgi:hypothetical protein